MMKEFSLCPECGGEMDPNSTDEVCSKCMMNRGLQTIGAESLMTEVAMEMEASEQTDFNVITEHPGRYNTVKEHARGSMGRVLLVHDDTLDRDIALKELLPEFNIAAGRTPTDIRNKRELAARFLREAKITGQLEHPSITPVHELGQRADGTFYYTMKLVRGRTLSSAIRACDNLKNRLALLPHFYDLCNAIAYAHSRHVLHRDIKPSNVLIGDFGETVVVDWGLAKVRRASPVRSGSSPDDATIQGMGAGVGTSGIRTSVGAIMGTPVYMPPEQAKGLPADERADIYSLGAVLYEILTGHPPFKGKSMDEILSKVIRDMPVSPSSIDSKIEQNLSDICLRALAKQPEDRYQTADRLGKAVNRWKPTSRAFRILKWVGKPAVGLLIVLLFVLVEENIRSSIAIRGELRTLELMGYGSEFNATFDLSDAEMDRQLLGSTNMSVAALMTNIGALFPELGSDDFTESLLSGSEGSLDWATPMNSSTERKVRLALSRHEGMIEMARLLGDVDIKTDLHVRLTVRDARSTESLNADYTFYLNWERYLNMLLLNARVKKLDGRTEEAFDTLYRCLNMLGFFSDTPRLTHQAMVRSYLMTVFSFMQANPELLRQDVKRLDRLDALLERIGREDALKEAVEIEFLTIYSYTLTNSKSFSMFQIINSERFPKPPTYLGNYIVYKTRLGTFVRNWIYVDHLKSTQEYLRSFNKPHAERYSSFASMHADNSRPYPLVSNRPMSDLLDIEAFDIHLTLVQLLRGAIALEKFYAVNSTYPEAIDELTPKFMDSLPYDYLSGIDLEYSKSEDTVQLRSPFTIKADAAKTVTKGSPDKGQRDQPGSIFSRKQNIEAVQSLLSANTKTATRISESELRVLLDETPRSVELSWDILTDRN